MTVAVELHSFKKTVSVSFSMLHAGKVSKEQRSDTGCQQTFI